ncbi:hydrogen gas-evolving membrane-bound hydrogenase subunit E [Microbispora rosea]|uniref:hydrogen gas-evolving membrane-bound hydrogenase subunit E n=1 Tax=Microbispora rosea TaxID=58117 RepID=UPI003425075D
MILIVALASMGGLALLAPLIERRLGRNTGYVIAAGFVAVAVLLGTAAPEALAARAVTASWPWMPQLGVAFTLRLDGLTALFCLLVLGVGALIMAYCPRYLPPGGSHGFLYFLLTLFGAAMLGLVLAGDLVLLVVFWELTTVVSFLLIGTRGRAAPAVRALLVTGIGGLALLAAVVLLAVTAGTTDLGVVLAQRQRVLDSPTAPAIMALLILAAFTKSAQVPFHFWLPGAMVAITPVSAYLHAATMVKAGIYLLLRFSTIYAGVPGWSVTLVTAGLVTALLGAARALREHDLKAMLAHSTVSQLGLLVAAIGVGTTVALAAAILHTFAHALFKATLFMLVGVIDREAGSRDIRELSGLMRVMPATASLTGLAALSLAGVPPLIGFVSKESLFQGFTSAGGLPGSGALAGALAVIASALTFAYGVRIFYGAFAGPTVQRHLFEPRWSFLAPAAIPAVMGMVLGPGVTMLNPLMRKAVLDIEPWGTPPRFAIWHGLSPELLMSTVTIALGVTLFLRRDAVDRLLRRLPPPGGGALFDRLYNGTLRLGAVVGRPDRTGQTWAFLSRPVGGLVLLGAAGVLVPHTLLPPPPADPVDVTLAGLLAVVVAGIVRTRSALAAVALTGLAGLTVSAWFLTAAAGADVALTLLLAEVLTAMVAAFVLRGLPARLPRQGARGTMAAGALAALAGLSAAGGVLTLTGGRDLSPAGRFFLGAAEPETGGRNVVNTILVDFRALDTLGEATVLAGAAAGLLLLLPAPSARRAPPYRLVLGTGHRLLAPVIVILSVYLFLRGHQEPGGGFIAALVAGIGVAFGALTSRRSMADRTRVSTVLLGGGLLLAVAAGLAALSAGRPFLTPLRGAVPVPPLGSLGLSSSMVFDLGVYLLVLGLMATAVNRLVSGEEAVG